MMKRAETDTCEPRLAVTRTVYRYPQPEAAVSVRDFLLTTVEGAPCLLLRWVMEADYPVERFTFELEELDPVGDVVGQCRVTCEGEDIPPVSKGDCFTPERGIPVHERCTDVRVRLLEVVSDGYVYRRKGKRMIMDYLPEEPWVFEESGGEEDGLSDTVSLRVTSKQQGGPRYLWLIALVSFLLTLLVILLPALSEEGEGNFSAEAPRMERALQTCPLPDRTEL